MRNNFFSNVLFNYLVTPSLYLKASWKPNNRQSRRPPLRLRNSLNYFFDLEILHPEFTKQIIFMIQQKLKYQHHHEIVIKWRRKKQTEQNIVKFWSADINAQPPKHIILFPMHSQQNCASIKFILSKPTEKVEDAFLSCLLWDFHVLVMGCQMSVPILKFWLNLGITIYQQ